MTTTGTGVESVGEATLAELAEGLHGELVTPGSTEYDEARSIWNGAHDRRPALDRPLRRCLRRDSRGRFRPQRGAPAGSARRRAQHPRLLHHRRRRGPRPVPDEGHPGRPGSAPGRRAGRLPVERPRPRNAGVRARADRRAGVDDRNRRVHPRRRYRLAPPSLRPDLRQPGRCRRRHRGRATRARQRRRAPRPVLGAARRRRQLRGGHLVRVRAARGRAHRLRRRGVLPRRRGRRGARRLPRRLRASRRRA